MGRFKDRMDLHVGAEGEEADEVMGLDPADPECMLRIFY